MSDQEETATIVVLRTFDAKTAKFEMSMGASLNDLKNAINQSALGPLPPANQRIFHLGRELKTGGRSLARLGVGRFKVYTVHLLAKGGGCGSKSNATTTTTKKKQNQSNTSATASDSDESDTVVEVVGFKRRELESTTATATTTNATTSATNATTTTRTTRSNNVSRTDHEQAVRETLELSDQGFRRVIEVVELPDDSSDDDDDDDVVEVVHVAAKRQKCD